MDLLRYFLGRILSMSLSREYSPHHLREDLTGKLSFRTYQMHQGSWFSGPLESLSKQIGNRASVVHQLEMRLQLRLCSSFCASQTLQEAQSSLSPFPGCHGGRVRACAKEGRKDRFSLVIHYPRPDREESATRQLRPQAHVHHPFPPQSPQHARRLQV